MNGYHLDPMIEKNLWPVEPSPRPLFMHLPIAFYVCMNYSS